MIDFHGIAIFASLLAFVMLGRLENMPWSLLVHAWGIVAASSLIGGFVAHQLFFAPEFGMTLTGIASVGLLYGGGAGVGGLLYWSSSLSRQSLLDAMVFAFFAGLCVARLGCHLDACSVGTPSSLWGLSFAPGTSIWLKHLESGLIDSGAVDPLWLHPFNLYLSIYSGVLALFAGILFLKQSLKPGVAGLVVISVYLVGRFVLEFLRSPISGGSAAWIGLSIHQLLVVPALLIAVAGAVWLRSKACIS